MGTSRRQFTTLLAAGVAGLAIPAGGAAPALAARPSGLDEGRIQAALDALVAWPVVGAVCSVVGPAGRFDTAAGRRSLTSEAPARPSSVARIASVTKAMTATAAFQQIERGRLSLDSTLGEVLPGLWPGREAVTLGQLLNHTSGMPDAVWVLMQRLALWDIPFDLLQQVISRQYSLPDLVDLAKEDGWWFEPGANWGYSNTGYVVAQMMIEQAAGRPLSRVLRDDVFRPAGMRRARLEEGAVVRGAEMQDTAVRPDSHRSLDPVNQSIFAGAAAVNGTSEDVTNFYQALMQGRLVGQDSVDAMTTPVGAAAQAAYGYGLFAIPDPSPEHQGETLWGHDGGGFGSISLAAASRDGARAFATTYVGRPYWQAGWEMTFPHLNGLLITAMQTNAAVTRGAGRDAPLGGQSAGLGAGLRGRLG